jgi:hypothetical protein
MATLDSVYHCTYDADDQSVLLVDAASGLAEVVPFVTFRNLTANHFSPDRAERVVMNLCCGRDVTVSWADARAGFRTTKVDRLAEVLRRCLSPANIQRERDLGETPGGAAEHRRALVSSLDL